MSFTTRLTLILILTLSLTDGLMAQETATAAPETATAATSTATTTGTDATATTEPDETTDTARTEPVSSAETRNEFASVIRRYPPEVATILTLDPSLLNDTAFLARYPDLASFVAAHPEVRHHPSYYLWEFERREPEPRQSAAGEIMESIAIAFTVSLVVFGVTWLIRTLVEQRRWNRLARTQAEVHNKILDRFSTSEELLTYIRTPAGTKFLESAPIPLHAEKPSPNTPVTRSILSIQIGVVIAAAAIGMLVVSLGLDRESAAAMFAMGVIAFCLGGGFIGSAAVSLLLSRRLGIWEPPHDGGPVSSQRVDDAGFVK